MAARLRLAPYVVAVVSAGCGGRVGDAIGESINDGTSSGGAFITTVASGGDATTNTESGGAESGGAESGDAAAVCPMTPCGGNVVGSWIVSESCFQASGSLDVSILGLGCTTGLVETMTIDVGGGWTANADGTFIDNTMTVFEGLLALPASCLNVSGFTTTCSRLGDVLLAMGFTSSSCNNSSRVGCECAVGAIQQGSMGVLAIAPVTSGKYWTSSQVLSMTDGADTTTYSYCTSDRLLRLSPQSGALRVPGSITLIRN